MAAMVTAGAGAGEYLHSNCSHHHRVCSAIRNPENDPPCGTGGKRKLIVAHLARQLLPVVVVVCMCVCFFCLYLALCLTLSLTMLALQCTPIGQSGDYFPHVARNGYRTGNVVHRDRAR